MWHRIPSLVPSGFWESGSGDWDHTFICSVSATNSGLEEYDSYMYWYGHRQGTSVCPLGNTISTDSACIVVLVMPCMETVSCADPILTT